MCFTLQQLTKCCFEMQHLNVSDFVFVHPSQLCLLLTKPGVSDASHAPPATPNSPSSK